MAYQQLGPRKHTQGKSYGEQEMALEPPKGSMGIILTAW